MLSVHKRASRIAVLGELGRYPLLIPALKLCLKYDCQLSNSPNDSLISRAIIEMRQLPHLDTYYTQMRDIKSHQNIGPLYGTAETIGITIDQKLKSSFDLFFVSEINHVKLGDDLLDHNKLRFYKQ